MAEPRRIVFPDTEAMSREAARYFTVAAAGAVSARGRFVAALSGGRTSKRTYALLAEKPFREEIPWEKVHVFISDERFVPVTNPESNFGVIQKLLLSRIPLPKANQHPFAVEAPSLKEAARESEVSLRAFPRFDLIFLGMGADGHAAGLFPGTKAFQETERLVTSSEKTGGFDRLSLTLPVLNAARQVIFLVAGEEKAEMVAKILEGNAKGLPAAAVNPPKGELLWFLDELAARFLA